MVARADGWTENRMPISHLAKAGATKIDPGQIAPECLDLHCLHRL